MTTASEGGPWGPPRLRALSIEIGELAEAIGPAGVGNTSTLSTSFSPALAETRALWTSGLERSSPSISTWVDSPSPPPNSSCRISSARIPGASLGRKSVNENRVSSWESPHTPRPPSTMATRIIRTGIFSASTEVRAIREGSRRSELALMPATGREPLDSIWRSTFRATISSRRNAQESLPLRSVRRSRILRAAGKKVRVRTNEAAIPMAARIPKSASGPAPG